MIEVAMMIEGQDGLTWDRWKQIARMVEDLGFVGLYRSDHFTNSQPPHKDSLELWVSLAWLASHTEHIEFGPLVTPVSFRHPVFTARIGKDIDDLSGGRLTLGIGAGWQEHEHDLFGFDLLPVKPRFDRFEESVKVITQLLRSNKPVDFSGEYFNLKGAELLPRPKRPGGPPVLIGGNGPNRTIPLTAQFADEWNGVFIDPDKFAELNSLLTEHIDQYGRTQREVRRSIMTGLVYGEDEQDLERWSGLFGADPGDLEARGLVVGGSQRVIDQLGAYAEAGAQRIMLQWLDTDNLARMENFAAAVLPEAHG
jgi:F420-dependent oxidoreductase-like protein